MVGAFLSQFYAVEIDPRVICTVAVRALHRIRRWRTVSLRQWRQWRRDGGAYKHRVRHIIKPPETTAKKNYYNGHQLVNNLLRVFDGVRRFGLWVVSERACGGGEISPALLRAQYSGVIYLLLFFFPSDTSITLNGFNFCEKAKPNGFLENTAYDIREIIIPPDTEFI